jgi:hypothetical protein
MPDMPSITVFARVAKDETLALRAQRRRVPLGVITGVVHDLTSVRASHKF